MRKLRALPWPSPILRGGVVAVLFISILLPVFLSYHAGAALVSLRRLQISDSAVSATNVSYNFGFTTNTAGPLGSLTFEVCSNYLYEPTDVCTSPVGFNASGAALSAQAGINDFSLLPASTASKLVIGRPAATMVASQPLSYTFSGITNPSSISSNYVRITTFATTDASGPETDFGNVVFATNQDVEITTEVPPYLLFCTGITIENFDCSTAQGSFINFGELSSGATRAATSEMMAATNAPYGYSVTLAGTTMTAGNNIIPAMTGNTSTVGTSQFGINGRDNSGPNIGTEPFGPGLTMPSTGYNTPNQYRFVSGEIVASSNDTDDYRKLTMSYIVNVSRNQPSGRYVTTVSYICLANF